MAEQQQQVPEGQLIPIKALYPAPPPFYKNFTKQNVTELKRLRKEAGIPPAGPYVHPQATSDQPTNTQQKDLDLLSLPPELRYLIPPLPPATGTTTAFGAPVSLHPTDPTLADHGITQLYPSHPSIAKNPQPQLLALARSLLTKYLHLLGVLSVNPEQYEQCTQDLETIVYNLHDLINRYRPHQARETLILMMEERVERLRGEIRGIEEGEKRAGELLGGFERDSEGLGEEGRVGEGGQEERGKEKGSEMEREARQRDAWVALEQEMASG